MPNDPSKPSVRKGEHQNTARLVLVLETLMAASVDGLRLIDVVEASGLSVAVAHRLLAGMVAYGLVDQDAETNRYFLGLKLLSLTAGATERHGIARCAEGPLEQLAKETGDTIYLSLPSGDDSVCVDRREGSFPIRTLTLNLGDRRPLGVGGGSMALLAFQEDAFIADILARDRARRQSYGIDDAWLEAALKEARARGYTMNDGRLIQGMSGVGVPICRADGRAVAALSLAAIADRLGGERLAWVVGLLKQAAAKIEADASVIINSRIAKRGATKTA
ncbi:IclR family transcriptional regulator [Acuticoccus mangrovi]|uniref:IclR family transcriptional regulator n=1 Tax=Acuticoccus mangrovi TaxID=2796142 RepID=A0A934MIL2_9HYPH|nr:IclR family transcriptional regulator [Acuticoccus mangrovi]MBJ3778030.1 IclR family transcriptional regulator [Acuticoccus mangrovi]